MLPVLLGLTLAIPLALATGRRLPGSNLLRTPEETAVPPVVARALSLRSEWQTLTEVDVRRLLRDTGLLEAHNTMLPPGRRPRIDPIDVVLLLAHAKLAEAEMLDDALTALSPAELTAALGDQNALRQLAILDNPLRHGVR
jgi:membrane glycosyltransferase